MNWFKKVSSPALLSPNRGRDYDIPPSLYNGNVNKIKIPTLNKRLQIFNYIKSKNHRINMYHGTSMNRYKEALHQGYLLSPNVSQTPANPVTPAQDQSFVFLTPDYEYAKGYAKPKELAFRKLATLFHGTHPGYEDNYSLLESLRNDIEKYPKGYEDFSAIITISVPLYAITEVRDAILGGMQSRTIGDEINVVLSDEPEEIFRNIVNSFSTSKQAGIFTSYLGLPVKWVTKVDKGESIIPDMIQLLDYYIQQNQGMYL